MISNGPISGIQRDESQVEWSRALKLKITQTHITGPRIAVSTQAAVTTDLTEYRSDFSRYSSVAAVKRPFESRPVRRTWMAFSTSGHDPGQTPRPTPRYQVEEGSQEELSHVTDKVLQHSAEAG